ncbi:hypothetical protein [Terrabacter sp. NPDC000476]|uniref:hypothetical protein n=1 Tax=Terrabacter sp. NPDC000476 TaxID=3154258 RepID=UPI00331E972A
MAMRESTSAARARIDLLDARTVAGLPVAVAAAGMYAVSAVLVVAPLTLTHMLTTGRVKRQRHPIGIRRSQRDGMICGLGDSKGSNETTSVALGTGGGCRRFGVRVDAGPHHSESRLFP